MTTRTLDLGCGPNPRNPYNADLIYGVDLSTHDDPSIRIADLAVEKIPFPTNYFDYVTGYDFLEHIPRILYIDGKRRYPFLELMAEIHRVLKPGGLFRANTPAYANKEAFSDPTHVNFITDSTVYYFTETPWIEATMKHYGINIGEFDLINQHWGEDGVPYWLTWEIRAIKNHADSIPVLIIPVLNNFDLLRRSLDTINHPIEEILIINNSGEPEHTATLQEEYPDLNIRVLDLPSNFGVAGSWNLGIKLYPHARYWLIASADTTPAPDTWKDFAERSNSSDLVISNGWFNMFSIGENVVKEVGLFDEYIYPIYYEDTDYLDRMERAGLKANIYFAHLPADENGVSRTVKANPQFKRRNAYTLAQNKAYYEEQKATGNPPKGWDITRRRNHEWI
jgi:SAM-dependent methyltransferase